MNKLKDTIVIYHSKEDDCWIAHSLKTDQVGTGISVVDALADALKAVHQVCKLAEEDPSIEVARNAPPEVVEIANRSKPLPNEIFEIAHKKVHGQWPEYLPIDTPVEPSQSFATETDDTPCGV